VVVGEYWFFAKRGALRWSAWFWPGGDRDRHRFNVRQGVVGLVSRNGTPSSTGKPSGSWPSAAPTVKLQAEVPWVL
jgi:hypothetical protein